MGKKYLDEVIDRQNTSSIKWDPVFLKEQFGRADLLPLWVADMDFKCPEVIMDAIDDRIRHGIFGYTFRSQEYMDAIKSWYKRRHNWMIEDDWIVFTPGIVSALNNIVQAFTHAGDKVIIQSPVYYPFTNAIENNGRTVVKNNLLYVDGTYKMDYEGLEVLASDPYVKLIILCSPHNPVGRVWSKEELKRFADICLKHDVLIVSDEIHSDLTLFGNKHTPLQSLDKEISDKLITCTAPSKTFNIAGLQTSNIIIPNKKLKEEFEQQLMRNSVELTNTFGMVAMIAAYTKGDQWLDDVLEYLEENVEFIDNFIENNMQGVKFLRPEGTYLGWLDFRQLFKGDYEALDYMLINEAKVAMDGGFWFGKEGNGFARINFACPRSILEEGLNRIALALKDR